MTTTIRWRVSRGTRRVLLITHLVSGLGLMGYLPLATINVKDFEDFAEYEGLTLVPA